MEHFDFLPEQTSHTRELPASLVAASRSLHRTPLPPHAQERVHHRYAVVELKLLGQKR